MSIKRRINSDHLITTRIAGTLDLAVLLNAVVDLGELTAGTDELWEILLLEDTLSVDPDVRVRMEDVHIAKETIQFKARGAMALVALSTGTRSICAQFADLVRGDRVPVTVFDDEARARRWLSIHMRCARFDATTLRHTNAYSPRTASRASRGRSLNA